MPDDEGKTQDDENNDFSGMAVFYRRAADDGNDDDQNGLEYVRFFEERVIGFFGHGDMQEKRKFQEDILHKIHFEKSPALMFQKYSIL